LTYETCLVYLDDIIVFSRDFDSHIERLREIFDRLKGATLKLHMKMVHCFSDALASLVKFLRKRG